MKIKKTKILGLVLALIIFFTNLPFGMGIVHAQTGDIEINQMNFPDEIFRTYVTENFDKNQKDGTLSQAELDAVKEIKLTDSKYNDISSLQGISYFKNLETLNFGSQYIEKIDLSNNTALKKVYLSCERLSDLKLGELDKLEELSCDYLNNHQSLDLSSYKSLKIIKIARCSKLTKLDVSGCKNLEELWVANSIFETIDLSNNTNLKKLNLFTGRLKKIDLRNNTKLTDLILASNSLKYLDLTQNEDLIELSCGSNEIKYIAFGKHDKLKHISVDENNLTALDLNLVADGVYSFSNQEYTLKLSEDEKNSMNKSEINAKSIYSQRLPGHPNPSKIRKTKDGYDYIIDDSMEQFLNVKVITPEGEPKVVTIADDDVQGLKYEDGYALMIFDAGEGCKPIGARSRYLGVNVKYGTDWEDDEVKNAIPELAIYKDKSHKFVKWSGEIPTGTVGEQEPITLTAEYDLTSAEKELKEAQAAAKEEIGKLPNLSEEEKGKFNTKVDEKTTKEDVKTVVEEAKAKDTENLKAAQTKAKEEIGKLNLKPEEKTAADKAIDDAKDKAAVDKAVNDAKAKSAANDKKAQELKEAKEKAKEEIKDLNLKPDEKTAADKAIDDAKDKDEVAKAVADAKEKSAANDKKDQEEKDKKAQELKEAKEKAKEEIKDLNLKPDEKTAADKAIDDAKDKDEVAKAVAEAKEKAAVNDKKTAEEKLQKEKDAAKEEIDKLPNLSEKEKKDAKDKVDNANTKDEVEKAVEDAKTKAEEKAKEVEKAKQEAEQAKQEAADKAKEAEEKAKAADKAAEEAVEKAKEAEEKAKAAEDAKKAAEEKTKEAAKAAEDAKKAKEESDADPNNAELKEKAKDAENKANEAKAAEEAAKEVAAKAEQEKNAAEKEAKKAADDAANAAEDAKQAKEAADNAQKEADKKAKEAEEKEKALPATPDDKNNAKGEIDKLPNLSDNDKKESKDKVDNAKTKGEVEKALEDAKAKSEEQKPSPEPEPFRPYWPEHREEERPYRPHRPYRRDKAEVDTKTVDEEKVQETSKYDKFEAVLFIKDSIMQKSVNGVVSQVRMDIAPFIYQSRTMLPIRFVAESLGFMVTWDAKTKTVYLSDKENIIQIPVETNNIIVNGNTFVSDVKPMIKNNRTMLPVANVARALGLEDGKDILWDAVRAMVTLKRNVLK